MSEDPPPADQGEGPESAVDFAPEALEELVWAVHASCKPARSQAATAKLTCDV